MSEHATIDAIRAAVAGHWPTITRADVEWLLAENARLQAVAEAARALVSADFTCRDEFYIRRCVFCDGIGSTDEPIDIVHKPDCVFDKLLAAVRTLDGEEG